MVEGHRGRKVFERWLKTEEVKSNKFTMKWYILAPIYAHSSAGVRCLYRLADLLSACGETAWIINGPVEIDDKAILIYPEVILGNPLKAKNVVRYLLNVPHAWGRGDIRYPDSEMVWTFHPTYFEQAQETTSQKIDENRMLFINLIEPDLFYNSGEEKTLDCFYLGKEARRIRRTAFHNTQMVEISFSWPPSRQKTAELLRKTKALYSFDHNTLLSQEALVCGAASYHVNLNGEMIPVQPSDMLTRFKYIDTEHIQNFVESVKDFFHID
jgi:hypothetical protein